MKNGFISSVVLNHVIVILSYVAYLNIVRLKETNTDSLTPQFFNAI